ncbi:MAG: hypothetical protein MJ247_07345 [Alphaproteobacteria bacterium]|nr:hypothetical protein [Alphaproteobacteria bacterium]
MSKKFVALRLEKILIDHIKSQGNFSKIARNYIIAGIFGAYIPEKEYLEELIGLREDLRRLGVNLNHIACDLHANKYVNYQRLYQLVMSLNHKRKIISSILNLWKDAL